MMRKIEEYTSKEIPPTDICIVGSGIAGMEIARSLMNTSLSITILEGGYDQFCPRIQKLHQFKQVGHKIRTWDQDKVKNLLEMKHKTPHLRQVGGNSNIWGRRFKFFDEYDFEDKPIYKLSSWPITIDELDPYYREIAMDYNFEELLLMRKHIGMGYKPSLASFPEFLSRATCKQEVKHNIKNTYLRDIENSNNITLIKGANVIDIALSENLKHATSVKMKSIEGKEWQLTAKRFILACGTIGNTRLLLSSNRQQLAGIGNNRGIVGRNLIDHPKYPGVEVLDQDPSVDIETDCILNPTPEWRQFSEVMKYKHRQNLFIFSIVINPTILKKNNLPNHSLEIHLIESMKESNQKLIPQFFLEQLPNMESKITLSDERDELNMPLPCIDWRFLEEDYLCFQKYMEVLEGLLKKHKVGTLTYDKELLSLERFYDASHQMGTTRMARSPEDGVTDTNCKVFGIDNLYIAGASLFPTAGGNSNPSFTILALARRLAKHIQKIAI